MTDLPKMTMILPIMGDLTWLLWSSDDKIM